jgi:integrase
MAELTDRTLQRKWSGKDEWLSDRGSRGAGRLVAKLAASGVTFYFQYYLDGRRRFLPIGSYDRKGERGKTLLQARDQAQEWSVLMRAGVADLHGLLEDQERDRQRIRTEAAAEATRLTREAQSSSLRQLLLAYTDHLERSGKQAVADVRRIFQLHVFSVDPDFADRKASSISVDDFVILLARLTEVGKGRTAGKLRSYLRAAYSLAMRAKTDPDAPLVMRTFGISANPIASIGALSKYNRIRTRVLNAAELSQFLRRLQSLPETPKRDLVMLCLQLGGQRPSQLLRVRLVDLDLHARTITLYDPKGARTQPRTHLLPVPDASVPLLIGLSEKAGAVQQNSGGKSPWLFTSDGQRALRVETVSALVNDLTSEMLTTKELREGFELRDLRRTCETMMAALGVSSDIRAQLQSHGLGGIQARHYDRHNYMEEKRTTLAAWNQHLQALAAEKVGEVIPMRQYR